MIFNDGEECSQKGGDLLWQRTMHSFKPGFDKATPADMWPEKLKEYGFIWTDTEGALIVRAAVAETLAIDDPYAR